MAGSEQKKRVGLGGRPLRILVALTAIAGLGAVVVWGFSKGRGEAALEAARERPVKAPLRVSLADRGESVVTLDVETRKQGGIEVLAPQPMQYQEQVRAYGTVLDLDTLVTLDNNYVIAGAQLQSAQARLVASKAAFERAETLYRDRTTSLAQFQSAEAIFRADQAAVAVAEAQVRTLKATAFQEWGPVIGKSIVDNGRLVKQLIERQAFLLQVTLPPGTSMAPPHAATVQLGASAMRPHVQLVSQATETDPKIQGLSFYYTASADSSLLPGMSVLAFLPSGSLLDAIEIPASAVVWWGGRAWVYLTTGTDSFARHPIPTDLPMITGGYTVPVASFPQPLPELVVRGAQVLLSEEFRAQIQVGEDRKK